jgi:hypothetical protein
MSNIHTKISAKVSKTTKIPVNKPIPSPVKTQPPVSNQHEIDDEEDMRLVTIENEDDKIVKPVSIADDATKYDYKKHRIRIKLFAFQEMCKILSREETISILNFVKTDQDPSLVIKGHPQSGKSKVQQLISLYKWASEQCVINILYQTTDVQQFMDNYKNLNKDLVSFLKLASDTIIIKPLLASTMKIKKDVLVNEEPIYNSFSTNPEIDAGIIISISHPEQLSKLYAVIKKKRLAEFSKSYYITLDEADVTGNHFSDPSRSTKTLTYKDITIPLVLNESIKNLKQDSKGVYEISATIAKIINDPKISLKTENIFILKPSSVYKGLGSFVCSRLDDKPTIVFHVDNIIKTLSNTPPYNGSKHKSVLKKYPRSLLITISDKIPEHKQILIDAKNSYKAATITKPLTYSKGWLMCTMNSSKGPKCITGFMIDKSGETPVSFDNLNEMYDYVLNNNLHRSLIIAGRMVRRAKSFCSSNYQIRLTDHIWDLPKIDQTDTIESMRMSCNKTDNVPLIMYAKPKQMDNIIKSLRLDTNIVEHITKTPGIAKRKVKEINLGDDERPTSKYCKGMKKIPCGVAGPGKPRTFQPVETPIGVEETKEADTTGGVAVKKVDEGVDYKTLLLESGIKIENLNKWFNDGDLLVGKMLRFLYNEKSKITVEAFKEGIDYDGTLEKFKNNIKNGSGVDCAQGKLWIKSYGQKVQINPIVKQYLDTIKK